MEEGMDKWTGGWMEGERNIEHKYGLITHIPEEEGDMGQVASENMFINLPLSHPSPLTGLGTPRCPLWPV